MGFRKNLIKIPILLFILSSCIRPEPFKTGLVLGTACSISLFEEGKSSIYHDIFTRLNEIENLMSVNIPSSDVSRINAAAGIEKVQVHEDVFNVIERALFFAELSGGAFDPSIGPIVSLWGISGDNPRVPSHAEIEEALQFINWRNIELNASSKSVFLKYKGMALDLGAIAKGYAADEAAVIIKNAGIKRALVDLGGNILAAGEKKGRNPWKVGIQNPNDSRGASIGFMHVTDKSVVTSGVYERNFEQNAVLYHHIFSPFSGYPSKNSLLSVTIIASPSIDADALSTAVFVLGYEKGKILIDSLPETEAVFIFEDLSIRKTSGADFTLTDRVYHLESNY